MVDRYQNKVNHKLKPLDKKRLINGLIKIVLGLNKSINQHIILNSFNAIGINPNCTVDTFKLLNKFHIKMNLTETDNVEALENMGIECFNNDGYISDEKLMQYLVVNNRKEYIVNRSNRVIHQQRCVILSNTNVKNNFQQLLNKKEIVNQNKKSRQELRLLSNNSNVVDTSSSSSSNLQTDISNHNNINTVIINESYDISIAVTNNTNISNENSVDTRKKYCICEIPSTDNSLYNCQMVECSNKKKCKLLWYHYDCLRLNPDWIPPDTWYCPACTRKLMK
jgi:hypothetical protein